MRVIVKRNGESINAAILSDSFFREKDPQIALTKLQAWETNYKEMIRTGKEMVDNIKASKDNLGLRWELGDLLNRFLVTNKEIELNNYEQTFARDLELPPTEKSNTEYAGIDIRALLGLIKIFSSKKVIDSRITWELVYFTYEIMLSPHSTDGSPINNKELADELLQIANHQAKLATKGNGAAKGVARKLVEILMKYNLLAPVK